MNERQNAVRSRGWVLSILAVTLLLVVALTGCGEKEPTAVEPAAEQIEQQADQTEANVDETINAAQEKVSELAAAVGGLEARISGLQVNSDLQEIQRKLTSAIDEAGDKKVAALEDLSTAFANVIAKVDEVAAKLPEGGPVQTELKDFSAKLTDVQTSLADAAASYEVSSTPSP